MIFVGVFFVPGVISVLRVCCAASQCCRAVIVHPDTDPFPGSACSAAATLLPSGSDGEEAAGPPVLAQGDLKKGPRSPQSKRPQTPELLGGFVQPKGVRIFKEMVPAQGDLEMAVVRVKVGG